MIGSSILLFLTFVGTLYLETQLRSFVIPELLLLCAGVFFGVVIMAGESVKSRWVWKLSTLYYAVAMANLAFLFMATGNFLVFALALFFALIAFIRAVTRVGGGELHEGQDVQTYEVDNEVITPDTVDPIIVQTTDTYSKRLKKTKKATRKTRKKRKTRKRR